MLLGGIKTSEIVVYLLVHMFIYIYALLMFINSLQMVKIDGKMSEI